MGIPWTDEEKAFAWNLRKVERLEWTECHKIFNEKFGTKRSKTSITQMVNTMEPPKEETKETKAEWKEGQKEASGTVVTAIKPKTLEEASILFQVDLNVWEAERMVINSWDVTNKYGSTFTNHQVKVWFKKKTIGLNLEEIAQSINAMIIPKKFPEVNYEKSPGGVLEINMADLHFGKLAWGEETGENYDFKIATERFYYTLNDAVAKASGFGYSEILFVVGNDFFNADNQDDSTSRGTRVDSDLRWQKRFDLGSQILINGIALLRETSTQVTVMVVPGNHDNSTMFYAGCVLEACFKNTPGVNIDNRPTHRKYFYRDGILLGFSHGEKEKAIDLFSLMVNEASDYTGVPGCFESAIVKEFHQGHYHHEHAKDYNGVTVRRVKSPSGTDSWHSGKGYVGSVKGVQSFLYSEDEGLQCVFHSNVKYGG